MQFRKEGFAKAVGSLFHLRGFKRMTFPPKDQPKDRCLSPDPSLPGRQKLDELVCLLIRFSSCVRILHLLGHLREVPAAAPQTDAGGRGTGAQPRVWHWG